MYKQILKQKITFCLCLLLGSTAIAQTFSDDFESYTVGDKLAATSPKWETWSSANGGTDDIAVTSDKANSGTKSLHFFSTASSGGPADIILPFDGAKNTGTFTFQTNLFVTSGKGAYFNFQENTTAGQKWAMDFFFLNDGNLEITNPNDGVIFKTNYSSNKWINFKLVSDLSSNTHEVFLDNVSQGTFQNGSAQIASMDIYPRNGDDFYVDDVAYSYVAGSTYANNAALTHIGGLTGVLSGASFTPLVQIRNLGTTAITAATVDIDYDGKKQTQNLSSLSIAAGAYYTYTWPTPFTIANSKQDFVATVSKINGADDENANDNSKSKSIDPVVPAAGRLVVGEEATGTWCGWCPRGAVMLKKMEDNYNDFFAGIAVHNGDPMAYSFYDKGMGTKISGYPSAIVDRGADIDPLAFESEFFKRITTPAAATMLIGANYDAQTKKLNVSVKTTMQQAINGNYKLALAITQDNVTGSDDGWAQSNYYAGGNNGIMGGYENLPSKVPANQMVYDHVARIISPSFTGLPNAYGTSAAQGATFIHNFSFDVAWDWNLDKMHLISMFIEPNGTINNGGRASISQAQTNGFEQGTAVLGVQKLNNSSLVVYPNPASSVLNIKLQGADKRVRIINAAGAVVYEGNATEHGQIVISALSAGLYSIQTAEFVQKFVKQ